MKPYQAQTVRLFNRLYNAKPFFWYGLPMRLATNGNNLHVEKSGKLVHTIIPLISSLMEMIILGVSTFLRMRNPEITSIERFIIIVQKWFILVYGIYFFLFLMDLLGYNDIMILICNLTEQYIEKLGKAVPAQRKIIRRPDLLNYTLRLFVWAGIILPPPTVLIAILIGIRPYAIIAPHIDSTLPWIYTWLPSGSMPGLKLAGFLVEYFVQVISTMDLFRCFILLEIVAIMAVQFFKNLIDLADAYFRRVQSLGKQGDMQHFKVHQDLVILFRIAMAINKLGSFIAIMIAGTLFVGFVNAVVRMHSIIPISFLFLCGLGVFITGYVQLIVCNYSAYINYKSKRLLQKYKTGLAMVGNVKMRREMVRCIKSFQPLGVAVGIGEITLFLLNRERKVFIFKSMLDYSMDIVLT
ncbi:hypothetical protein Fcan01_10162 [Folsomia candida]|uniref:Uncharacterized protein n=1 Tax=Folsomia candida TaxID=158441 RepID=A0A226ED43_FOLCA|nr:hypothetical protein Fcan01_10162 [Folsomia candida]